jgi:endonuclease/exonuclease/phosphatase family metal-dependent hydrolase
MRAKTAACLAFAAALVASSALRAEPARLRVLTWNVWGLPAFSTNLEARMAALPDAIAKLDPDLVLLQEIWAESDGLTVKQGLERHGYRHTSHLAHTEYGMTGLFTASRLPLKPVGFRPFASGRIGHSIWHLEWIASKGVGSFLVQTPLGEVQVQNTHLQAQYETDAYDAERLSQVSEIALMQKGAALPLVLGGDFNTGSEELPRKALLDLISLRDTTPSPRPDTIFVRDGSTVSIRLVESRELPIEAVKLQNGVIAPLSDHPAVVADLELSVCPTPCAPATVASTGMRAEARTALTAAAANTPFRVMVALSAAASLLVLAVALFRRKGTLGGRRGRHARRLCFVVLSTGFVWTAYLGGLYYPSRAKALRFVAGELEELGVKAER